MNRGNHGAAKFTFIEGTSDGAEPACDCGRIDIRTVGALDEVSDLMRRPRHKAGAELVEKRHARKGEAVGFATQPEAAGPLRKLEHHIASVHRWPFLSIARRGKMYMVGSF